MKIKEICFYFAILIFSLLSSSLASENFTVTSLGDKNAKVTVKTQVHMCSFNVSLEMDFARIFIFTLITFVVFLAHVDKLVVFLHPTSIPESLTTGCTESWPVTRLHIVLVPLTPIIRLHVTLKALLKTKCLLASRTK